jgi:hypothetical protein
MLIDKLQQKFVFHSNVVFNEPTLIPIGKGGGDENGPIDDTLANKDEGFMPFNNENKEPIVIPPLLPIVLLPPLPIVNPPMGKSKVSSTFL